MSQMILFRTHLDTDFIRQRFAYLRDTSGMPAIPLVDRTHGSSAFNDVATLDVGLELFRGMGLRAEPDAAWRCGDYNLYAARRRFPDVAHFWMIEYDVMFSFDRAADFFSRFHEASAIDFLAADLRQADKRWHWHASIAPVLSPVARCLFPVVRVSATAIDHLFQQRKSLSSMPDAFDMWPNDEAFVATVLQHAGFRIADLNSRGLVYRPAFFSYGWSMPDEPLRGRPIGLIFHPVLDSDERARKRRSSPAPTLMRGIKRRLRGMRTAWSLRAYIAIRRAKLSLAGIGARPAR